MTTLEALLILNKVPGVHAHTVRLLDEACKDLSDLLCPDGLAAIEKTTPFGQKMVRGIQKILSEFDPGRECEYAKKNDISIVAYTDERYPQDLLATYDPPVVLYVKGNAASLTRDSIAMVGSRSASFYGKEMARSIAASFARRGIPVVSGMARGIDAAAHQGVLSQSGVTVAVLGCGVDVIYPRLNKKIYESIIACGGAIVSEFSLGMVPYPANFPQRNRIISGMTRGTIVVEAAQRSGSLITARLALEEGREVFCLPGQATSVRSRGTNNLIKEGAVLITDAQEVIDTLFEGSRTVTPPQDDVSIEHNHIQPGGNTEHESQVLSLIGREPVSVDQLLSQTSTCIDQLYSLLLRLELKRQIKRCYSGGYTRVA